MLHGQDVPPIAIVATDITTEEKYTNLSDLLATLRRHGIKLAIDSDLAMKLMRMEKLNLNLINYEHRYLTREEISAFGRQGLVSANFLGAKSIQFLHDTFFNHTIFGKLILETFFFYQNCISTNFLFQDCAPRALRQTRQWPFWILLWWVAITASLS